MSPHAHVSKSIGSYPQAVPACYADRYDGIRVFGRGVAVTATIDENFFRKAAGFEDRGWERHPIVPSVWIHSRYPGHLACRSEGGWAIVQRVAGRAALGALQAAGDSFAGFTTDLIGVSAYPRALRVPLRIAPGADVPLPSDSARCQRIGPGHYLAIHGHEIELRVSRTTRDGAHRLYAEAFVERHENISGVPRALLFLPDARRVLRAHDTDATGRFTARLLDTLLGFVDGLAAEGLVPEVRRLQLPVVAIGRTVTSADDMVFDVRLPSPDIRRFATSWTGAFTALSSDADLARFMAAMGTMPLLNACTPNVGATVASGP